MVRWASQQSNCIGNFTGICFTFTGVGGNNATPIVLAEFGRYPLRFHRWQQILQYHNHINNLFDNECLIKCAFVEGLHDR